MLTSVLDDLGMNAFFIYLFLRKIHFIDGHIKWEYRLLFLADLFYADLIVM